MNTANDYVDNLAMMALPALEPLARPNSFEIQAPVRLISFRSMPVVAPRLCRQCTRSSVATLPVAPFEYGHPPNPPTLLSKVRIPCSRPTTALTSAWPYVSWKWRARSWGEMPDAKRTRRSSWVLGPVPIPVVSATETSSAPISNSVAVISATLEGATSEPSYGQPSATET